MPRKLKTYQTSQGFYDLAIAAPSMKAALAAWGTSRNLFHQGFAKESEDAKSLQQQWPSLELFCGGPLGRISRSANTPNCRAPHRLMRIHGKAKRPGRKPAPRKQESSTRRQSAGRPSHLE